MQTKMTGRGRARVLAAPQRQRGISLIGLFLVGLIVVALIALGFKVIPAVVEYLSLIHI